MTIPIRRGTARRLGLRQPESPETLKTIAEFGASLQAMLNDLKRISLGIRPITSQLRQEAL